MFGAPQFEKLWSGYEECRNRQQQHKRNTNGCSLTCTVGWHEWVPTLPSSSVIYIFIPHNPFISLSQLPRGLRRRSAAARLLRFWVQISPVAWMPISCEFCVLSGRGLRQADHSSRGVLPIVMRRCLWSRNLMNEKALARAGPRRYKKKNNHLISHLNLTQFVCTLPLLFYLAFSPLILSNNIVLPIPMLPDKSFTSSQSVIRFVQ
jgi:hypothetical protein